MRRTAIALLSFSTLACQPAKPPAEAAPRTNASADPAPSEPATPSKPAPSKPPKPASEPGLAPAPTLAPTSATVVASGEFEHPEGTDELAPRVALALADGLLLAGQAYHQRNSPPPPQSWRWTGFIPSDPAAKPTSRLHDPGAIRGGIASDGGGLLTGTRGLGFDARGWFATVDGSGVVRNETPLDNPSETEMFAVLPGQTSGQTSGEFAVLGGYVDAQGWLVSLDADGQQRWEKYLGSYGYTQVRTVARLASGDLLALGSRGAEIVEAYAAKAPGDGGESAASTDAIQTKIEIEGAEQHRGLEAVVDLGEQGFIALGTAKQTRRQAHAQVIAAGFDQAGELAWSRVVEGVRVIDVHGARAHAGAAVFVVSVPSDDEGSALALVRLSPDNPSTDIAERLTDSEGWTSAGFIDGTASAKPELIAYLSSATGLRWRRLAMPESAH